MTSVAHKPLHVGRTPRQDANAMGGDDPFRVTYESGGSVVALWRNVVLSVYAQPPMPEAVTRAAQDIRAQFVANKKKQLWLAHFVVGEGMPEAARVEKIRVAFMALLRETHAMMHASVNVIDGTGFAAAALRAAGLGLITLARAPYPIKTFATVPEGAAYLGKARDDRTDATFEPTLERIAGELLLRARRSGTS